MEYEKKHKQSEQETTSSKNLMIFISKIPPQTKKNELKNYLHSKIPGGFKIRKFVNKQNSRAPKIAEVRINDENDFNRVLGDRHFFHSGIELKVEKILKGEELQKKMYEEAERKVSVLGIVGECTSEQLKTLFQEEFGPVDYCYLKRCKGVIDSERSFAFVCFFDKKSAEKAIMRSRVRINGRFTKIKRILIDKKKTGRQDFGPRDNSHPTQDSKCGNEKKFERERGAGRKRTRRNKKKSKAKPQATQIEQNNSSHFDSRDNHKKVNYERAQNQPRNKNFSKPVVKSNRSEPSLYTPLNATHSQYPVNGPAAELRCQAHNEPNSQLVEMNDNNNSRHFNEYFQTIAQIKKYIGIKSSHQNIFQNYNHCLDSRKTPLQCALRLTPNVRVNHFIDNIKISKEPMLEF